MVNKFQDKLDAKITKMEVLKAKVGDITRRILEYERKLSQLTKANEKNI